MLKLLKYEWKSCARVCLPVYGVVLLISLLNRFLWAASFLENFGLYRIVTVLLQAAYASVMVAVFVITTVILLQRFYKSLLGDEGYLMFVLPVTVTQHIWAKALISTAVIHLSVIASLASVCIMGASMQFYLDFSEDFIREMLKDPQSILHLLEAILLVTLLFMCMTLFMYLCIALGHMAKKHRIAMAVVWYFVLTNVIEFIIMLLGNIPWTKVPFYTFLEELPPHPQIHIVLLLFCALTAAFGTAFFFGTKYILQNRLNLE